MSNYKNDSRQYYAARAAEERAAKAQREQAARDRNAQNALLRQHGYTWSKVQDTYSGSDDGDSVRYEWVLAGPDGKVTTVKAALAAIEAEKATTKSARDQDTEHVCAPCRDGKHEQCWAKYESAPKACNCRNHNHAL